MLAQLALVPLLHAQTQPLLSQPQPPSLPAGVHASASVGVEITALPTVITAPGRYYLSGSLTGFPNLPGLIVNSDNVTIDLQGNELIGVTFSGIGIDVVFGKRFIRVLNGTIREWGSHAIGAGGASGSRFSNLRLSRNGLDFSGVSALQAGPGTIVEDCLFQDNGSTGLWAVEDSRIRDCAAIDNGDAFILSGAGTSLADSTTSGLGVRLLVSGKGCRVVRCRVSGEDSAILQALSHAVVSECHVSISTPDEYSSSGLVAEGGCRIVANQVSGHFWEGLRALNSRNLIDGNVVTGPIFGFKATGSGNLVIRNQVMCPLGPEFTFVPGNHYAEILATPGLGFTSSNRWANIAP